MDLAPHIQTFTEFASSHLTENDEDNALINLKLDHCKRVLKNAELITHGESITGHIGSLCHLGALYHDIGRFPQYTKYRTFKDRDSENHGRLGVLTLRKLDLPGTLTDRDWRTIRFSIAQHNVIRIRETLADHLAIPTKVVRDADKLDIYRVLISHFTSGGPLNAIMTHGVSDTPNAYSEEIIDAVLSGEAGDYSKVRYANDFKILIIGWLFDLNFPTSIKLLAQRNHLNDLFSLLPKDNKIQTLEEKTRKYMHYNNHETP